MAACGSKNGSGLSGTGRRDFLKTAGGAVAAAAVGPVALMPSESAAHAGVTMNPAAPARKIPIGVFDPVYSDLSTDAMLDKISALGLEAIEIGTGGYPGSSHCPVSELLADSSKLKAWKNKFDDRNLRIATLSCHGNPVHPDESIANADAQTFRQTVLLAERLGVKVIVGFSGCPGGAPGDKTPAWITYHWPPEHAKALEWQWKEKVIPYWEQAAKFARQHGIQKLAFEMHPNFVVYNPKTLLKLREAVGEEIGANCDLSHLFWQGCDPVTVIRMLGGQGAIFHAHMKDTVLYRENVAKYGVLNFAFEKSDLPEASDNFRAVGYGHGAEEWKEIIAAYMEIGYEGILSIENEDPELSGPVGVERAAYVLKNVRDELLAGAA
ncbi:MAG TPA: sugar phosphate isomerase/epimerase [Candidatus Acidoferrales bacterium]|nr:sugar phosphate isomerase/epimerase [Candidatus Acidoferrales bacterium]